MKISLVTATLGRVDEINILLDSLVKQTYKNFELIIVDQNEHYKVQNIVDRYTNILNIKYIRSSTKGLSYNRNVGIKECSGDIIGFPDDDCYYSDNLLEEIVYTFKEKKNKITLVEAYDSITKNIFISKTDVVSRKSLFKYAISFNLFVIFDKMKLFDERLGVGTFFSSGEETDYIWQLLDKKDIAIFAKKAKVFHPQNAASNNYERAYSYGLGFGALFKKEILGRKHYTYFIMYLKYLIRCIGGIVLSSNKKFYWGSLKGRIKGFLLFKL